MSLVFSRQCEYALQAVLYLALKSNGEMTSIRELTRKLDIPYHFVAKILQTLTQKRLLTSLKGPKGGFALAEPATQTTLLQIVRAIDGDGFMKECVLGFPECSGTNPCAVHGEWKGIRDRIQAMLIERSVTQMAKEMKKPEYRLYSAH